MASNNTACSLLWSAAAVDMNGEVLPCCRFQRHDYAAPIVNDGMDAVLHGDMFTDVRRRLLAGEKINNCNKCWEQEASTGRSMRTDFNEKYGSHIEKEPKLRYLEIGFSTHCNLACRMCDEEYSSKWSTIKNNGKRVEIGFDMDIDGFDVPLGDLEEIKVIGGEPMMARQHDQFVDKLLSSHTNLSNVIITYHTNGTILPSERVLAFWKQLKKVQLFFSIDGVGAINEFQRPGHSWQTILDNIEYYKKLDGINIRMGTHTTITSLNVNHLAEFYSWWETVFQPGDRQTIDTAEGPAHLCIQNMSDDAKESTIKYIGNEINNITHKKQIINKLNSTSKDVYTRENIIEKEQLIDNYFKQNTKDMI